MVFTGSLYENSIRYTCLLNHNSPSPKTLKRKENLAQRAYLSKSARVSKSERHHASLSRRMIFKAGLSWVSSASMHCFPRCPINLSNSETGEVQYIQLERQEGFIVLSAFPHITRRQQALEEALSSQTGAWANHHSFLFFAEFIGFTFCQTVAWDVLLSCQYSSLGIKLVMICGQSRISLCFWFLVAAVDMWCLKMIPLSSCLWKVL